jgi:O-succinylhomoserine sulfhydrylase
MLAHSRSAQHIAEWLTTHPAVTTVYYPGLPQHPQHGLIGTQMDAGGGIVAFEVAGGTPAAWQVIDHTRLLSITANLGDTKTTITHPATTTHARLTPAARHEAGIHDGLIRLAIGLEAVADIQADLDYALAARSSSK